MRKIDVNCMVGTSVLWEDEPAIRSEEALWEAVETHGIERVVAAHIDARHANPIIGNEKLLKLAAARKNLIPCLILSPHYKYDRGWFELEQQLQAEQIQFVKLYPSAHGFSMHGAHMRQLLDMAARLKLHVLFDQAEIIDASGVERESFEALLRDYPTVNIIVAAIRHRRRLALYNYLEQHPNFYTEFSVFSNWLAYEEAVGLFGSTRLLWGSNMPVNAPGASATMLAYANIAEEDKCNIAYRNALRLMGGSADDFELS